MVWCHTHGLEHFGLPDLECQVGTGDLPVAERLIQAAIDHLLQPGAAFEIGTVIEAVESDGSSALRFQIDPARPMTDHQYGPLGAWQLVMAGG